MPTNFSLDDEDLGLDAGEEDPESVLIARIKQQRQRLQDPLIRNQGTNVGEILADLALGIGTSFAGGSGAEAVGREMQRRGSVQAQRLKALQSGEEGLNQQLLNLAKLRETRAARAQREREIPIRMQMQLENQLSLMAATGANQQALEKYRQSGQTAIRELDAKLKAEEAEKQRAHQLQLERMRQSGATQRAKGPGGGRPLGPDKIIQLSEATAIPNTINDLRGIINANKEKFGPVEGRIRSMNPYDETAQAINAAVFNAKQTIGKLKEGGVLRAEDERKYEKMLPMLSDTPASALNKLDLLERELTGKYNQSYESLQKSGYDVTGLPSQFNVPKVPPAAQGKPGMTDLQSRARAILEQRKKTQ